jgi:iron(III) transport system permease protein
MSEPGTFWRRQAHSRWRRHGVLPVIAIVVGVALSLPLLFVLASWFERPSPAWLSMIGTVLPGYVVNSIFLGAMVGIGVALIGVATAWLVVMCRFPGRRLFEFALILPLAMPAYVMAYAYTDLLQFAGPVQAALRDAFGWQAGEYWFPNIRSLPGAGLMLTLALYPYVYLLARASFLEQSACALDVARSLGRSPWRMFVEVAVPLARPAIAAGVALALMETLADYGTVDYFGVPTFTTGIYRAWFSLGDPVAAGQLAGMLLLAVAALIGLERWSRGRVRYQQTSGRYRALPSFELKPAGASIAMLVCALVVGLGFVVPAYALIELAASQQGIGAERLASLAFNSVSLAGAAALTTVGIAVLIGYANRIAPQRALSFATAIAVLGYAVPGSIIAIGLMRALALFDAGVGTALDSVLGGSNALLGGSLVAMLFLYASRFLAAALQAVRSGLSRITRSIDDASRSLARGPVDAGLRVHVPMIAPSALTALLIVFVEVMKELPGTLILRPFNFDTLAVAAYNYAADERLAEAARPALAIVVAGLIPVVLLIAAIARVRPGQAPKPTMAVTPAVAA